MGAQETISRAEFMQDPRVLNLLENSTGTNSAKTKNITVDVNTIPVLASRVLVLERFWKWLMIAGTTAVSELITWRFSALRTGLGIVQIGHMHDVAANAFFPDHTSHSSKDMPTHPDIFLAHRNRLHC